MFKKSADRLEELGKYRGKSSHIPYGVPFLDDITGGLYPDDVVIVTGKSGFGKTELLTHIVSNAAEIGRNVHMFALEAHKDEIEARMKFKRLANAFYLCTRPTERDELPDYQDWMQGKQEDLLAKYEKEVDVELRPLLSKIHTFYTDKDFSVSTFESHMHRIGNDTDLIVLDHLHYMDLEEDNENRALKKTIKQIKIIAQSWRKPVIVAAQLKKVERQFASIVPEMEDVHGSSDVVKIATRIVGIAPAYGVEGFPPNAFPTYFTLMKNRTGGARCRFLGMCGFDVSKNEYMRTYEVGRLSSDRKSFLKIKADEKEYPQWARRRHRLLKASQTSFTLNGEGNGTPSSTHAPPSNSGEGYSASPT